MSKYISKATLTAKVAKLHRSAWKNGVTLYALDMIEELFEDRSVLEIEKITGQSFVGHMLSQGYDAWIGYSRGGCSLIYDRDIAERLCTPSELKRTENGMRNPNKRETWLDVQGRALFQAANLIKNAIREEYAA